jgi:hypothetical protein
MIAFNARWNAHGFFLKALHLFGQALIEGRESFEAAAPFNRLALDHH